MQDSDLNEVRMFLYLWTPNLSSLCLQDSDLNEVRMFLYLWTLNLSSIRIQDSDLNGVLSVPVSLDTWFEFYATSDSILESPPSLCILDLRRPWLGCPAPLRYLQRKNPEQDLQHPDPYINVRKLLLKKDIWKARWKRQLNSKRTTNLRTYQNIVWEPFFNLDKSYYLRLAFLLLYAINITMKWFIVFSVHGWPLFKLPIPEI